MVDSTDAVETPIAGVAQPRQSSLWTSLRFGAQNPLHALIGLFLLVLVIGSAASAVVFFAAAQFQSRVAELSLNGAPMTIWRVDEFRADFKNWAEDIRRLRDGIAQDQINLAKDKQNNFVLTADQDSAARRLGDDARSLKQKVLAASAQGTSSPATGQSETDQNISDVITQTEMLLTRDDLQNRFGTDLAAVKKRYDESTELRARIENRQAKIKGYETWIANLQEQRKDRVDAAAKLFGVTNTATAPELVERIVNVTAELNSLSNIWGGVVYDIALWTNDMLVLLLLISMGVLGSALNLLAAFISNDRDSMSFGEYPLRLAFGAVLAIVMFIIAKAGVPILADTGKIGGNAPLNPYFISLLAVVSGLMSDRSMTTIRNVASSLLERVGGGDYSQRYSRVALDDALKTANRTVDGLAQTLGISVDHTKKLFSGNDKISPDSQKMISAYLGASARDLFSDLPAN
jgi:hypothetical protein